MTFDDGSHHGQYTLEDDLSGRGLLPEEMPADKSDSGRYLNDDCQWGNRSATLLASRNQETTPLESPASGHHRLSNLRRFMMKETRARSETFSRNVDFAQREADLFAQRRSTTFLNNIDYAQEHAEELARSGGTAFSENVNWAQEQVQEQVGPSVSSLADSIDSVQEQVETVTRDLGQSISQHIDYAQEQAEMFTQFLASSLNVFGGPALLEEESPPLRPKEMPQRTNSSSSVKEFLDARVDTFTKNIEFSTREVERALWHNQPAFFPQ